MKRKLIPELTKFLICPSKLLMSRTYNDDRIDVLLGFSPPEADPED